MTMSLDGFKLFCGRKRSGRIAVGRQDSLKYRRDVEHSDAFVCRAGKEEGSGVEGRWEQEKGFDVIWMGNWNGCGGIKGMVEDSFVHGRCEDEPSGSFSRNLSLL